jgi:hypothetical protein
MATKPKFLNTSNLGLSVAVWLAHDGYDHNEDPNVISATGLLKPIKQIVLGARVDPANLPMEDLLHRYKSRIGTAIHNDIEAVWTNVEHRNAALKSLGYPDKIIDRIKVNPTQEEVDAGCIPVYTELRTEKSIAGFTVSGEFDFVIESSVEDFKSTGVYTYIKGVKIEDYKLQGSIYRWLNPDLITGDSITIQYIFTDWKANEVSRNPKYPKEPMISYTIPLLSLRETEKYIVDKLTAIKTLWNADESTMPECTDDELGRSESVFKYYKNPNKTEGRSTKNFDSFIEAQSQLATDGFVGVIIEKKGQIFTCKYCPAFSVCQQKNQYLLDESLTISGV